MADAVGAAHGGGDRCGVGALVGDLEISRAWLVDPASGREGPGELVVEDGLLAAVTWLEGAEAEGVDDRGIVVAPGFVDLHAHFREPGFEDAETVATGRRGRCSRRLHDGLPDAQHRPGDRRGERPGPGPRGGGAVGLAGRDPRLRRGQRRAHGRDPGRAR